VARINRSCWSTPGGVCTPKGREPARRGDATFDQFFAWQVPFVQEPEVTQALNRDVLVPLIDKLGQIVLMTQSQSDSCGLL
jgi:hypothetical protein